MMFRVSYELSTSTKKEEMIVEAESQERAIEWVTEMVEQNQDGDVALLEISAEAL